MDQKELIRIGLPVYNGEAHLAEALESLLHQTYENFELFLVDNVSTDKTPDIAKAYAKKDPRLTYIRQKEWGNVTANWRRTYDLAARGVRFFMWTSHDDLWAKDYIEQLLPPLLDRPEVVLSFSRVAQIDKRGQVTTLVCRDDYPTGDTAFGRIRSIINSCNFSPIYGIIRTAAVQWIPCLIETCFGPDLWFLLQLSAAGKFHMTESRLFYKRLGGISETGQESSTSRDPDKTWNIGQEEWNLIRDLNLSFLTKLYIYYRLKIIAKALYPRHKEIPLFLQPFYCYYMLRNNPRHFGIRSGLRRTIFPMWGDRRK